MQSIWSFFDGKKTLIATVLLILAAFIEQVMIGQWGMTDPILPKIMSTLDWFGMVLGGFGLTHKGIKVLKGAGDQ